MRAAIAVQRLQLVMSNKAVGDQAVTEVSVKSTRSERRPCPGGSTCTIGLTCTSTSPASRTKGVELAADVEVDSVRPRVRLEELQRV